MGYALGFGIERSGFDVDFDITALRVGPRVWLDTRIRRTKLRVGADMLATSGKIKDPLEDEEFDDVADGGSSLQEDPIYRSATGRNVLGLYTEMAIPLAPRWDLEAGLRGDLWITGGQTQQALEPRFLLRHQVHERVGLHAAFGLAYQPAVFPIPLPSVADVALDRGLQRAIQHEFGSSVELPSSFRAETKLFLHLYHDMLSLEALEGGDVSCDGETCEEEEGFARMNAHAYGAEFLLRRDYAQRFSGWLAYTLSKADGHTDSGRPLTPNFDVRHVANLVLQWRISQGFHASMRGYVQSGRFPFGATTVTDPRARERLPTFFRGDLQISRIWPRPWGELRFSFEWLNFTFQREPVSWDCPDDRSESCRVQYIEFPITIPMLGVRGTY
jgi:hypothetical protein